MYTNKVHDIFRTQLQIESEMVPSVTEKASHNPILQTEFMFLKCKINEINVCIEEILDSFPVRIVKIIEFYCNL